MTATRPKFVRPVYVLGGYEASQRELARCTTGISAQAQLGQSGWVVSLPMPRATPPGAASPLAQPAPADAGVKAIRAKTKLSQVRFAAKLRVPVATLRDWEQHRRSPDAPARTLLGMVDADPKAALDLISGQRVSRT